MLGRAVAVSILMFVSAVAAPTASAQYADPDAGERGDRYDPGEPGDRADRGDRANRRYRRAGQKPRKQRKNAKVRPIGIALFTPVALFHHDDTIITGLAVSLLYGHSRAVYGAQIGLINNVREDVGLVQIGLLANRAGGSCVGLCAAGFLNVHGGLTGIQATVAGNDATRVNVGLQLGLFNAVRRDAKFVIQIGMLSFNNRNVLDMMAALGAKKGDTITVHKYTGTQRGIQLGVGNGSDDYRGIQLGFVNVAKKGKGIEAGVINVSENYTGLQMGVWNHATRVHGIQLGVINTAKWLRGVQLGIINVATKNTLPVTVLINAGF